MRLDGGFAEPELFEFLDIVGVDYVVGMARNQVLEREAELDLIIARVLSEVTGKTAHVYTDYAYAAGTWDRERRVVCKAEVVRLDGRAPRLNPRFVVTNLRGKAQRIYERIYCMRGEVENRIKELFEVALDRTSCTKFLANQLRVLLAAAAYVLLQELRLAARGTAWARAQVATLRLELLKIGVQVIASVRRLVQRLPAAFPYRDGRRALALRSGATPGLEPSRRHRQPPVALRGGALLEMDLRSHLSLRRGQAPARCRRQPSRRIIPPRRGPPLLRSERPPHAFMNRSG